MTTDQLEVLSEEATANQARITGAAMVSGD